MSENQFAEEPLILARLRAQIPFADARHVASVAAVIGVLDIAPLTTALFLQPGAAEVVSSSEDGRAALEDQTWIVIAAFAHVPDPKNLTTTYEIPGAVLRRIKDALMGWKPALPGFRPMKYAGLDEAQIAPGHIEFPLRFSVRRPALGAGGG
jgi:hypothetical protein